MGAIQADQDTSFQAMDRILLQMVHIVAADPAVDTVNGFTGGGNTARMFVSLKPLAERQITVDYVIARLRPKLARVPGRLFSYRPRKTFASVDASVTRNTSSRCGAIISPT